MTTLYDVVYPSKGVMLLDGGLNNKFEKSIIEDNESPDCANVVFSYGSVGTRGGSSKLNTATVGTFVCDGLYTRRDDGGSETMIAFHGGTARYLAGTSFHTIPSALSVFTAGNRVATTQYRDNIFIGNGGVIPYKYNGTDFTRHGVYPPASNTIALVSGATGGSIVTGDWSYKVTYMNSYSAESDLVATAVTINVVSGMVSITCIPVAPQSWGVSARRIYRSSGATYNLVATISDNTTTTYNDTLGTPTSSAPSDNGVPPKYSVCVYHANRLFVNDAANPNYVWYSELDEPFTFPSVNFFKVGDASSDLVKALSVYDNSVVVHCENSNWINYMTDPSDDTTWRQIRVRANLGCKSPFGTFQFNNRVGFPAFQNTKLVGFAALAGDVIEPSSTFLTISVSSSQMMSDKIETDVFDVQEAYAGNISAIVFQNKAYITVTYGSNQTTNNRIYEFDFSNTTTSDSQKFTWSPTTGLSAAQFAIYGGSLYFGSSSTDGFVYQMETTSYNDNSSAINSYFWTKELSGNPGHENLPKDFRKVKFLADLPGNYYMKMTWKVDSDSGGGQTKNISLNPGGSLWNTMRWGIDVWGGGKSQYEFEIPLGQTQGKRIQFKFDNQNTADQRFKIHRMSYTYNIRGRT